MNKKASGFWSFIGENIVALSTVFAGVFVLVWQATTDPSNLDPISAAMLALICLLATSEVVERRKRLDKIQNSIDNNIAKILSLLPLAEIKRFPDSISAAPSMM